MQELIRLCEIINGDGDTRKPADKTRTCRMRTAACRGVSRRTSITRGRPWTAVLFTSRTNGGTQHRALQLTAEWLPKIKQRSDRVGGAQRIADAEARSGELGTAAIRCAGGVERAARMTQCPGQVRRGVRMLSTATVGKRTRYH